jgi:hypothetical protein
VPTHTGYSAVTLYLKHTLLTRPACLTFGVNGDALTSSAVAAAVITAVTDTGSLKTLIDANVTINRVRVATGTGEPEDDVYDGPAAVIGANVNNTSPANVAILVHKRTASHGRQHRGRMFLPWALGTSNIDEAGIIQTSSVTNLQSAMNAFHTALQTNSVPMYLLHQPPKVGSTPFPTPVTQLVVDPMVSTQRRRLAR